VKVWTVHTRPFAPPVLVAEGFSWGATLFGPLWLLAHRAWIPAGLVVAAEIVVGAVPPRPLVGVLALALAWLLGLVGNDLRRWSLARRGFVLSHVVAASNAGAAEARLYGQRPDLAREALA
jgi:hypothetical protein